MAFYEPFVYVNEHACRHPYNLMTEKRQNSRMIFHESMMIYRVVVTIEYCQALSSVDRIEVVVAMRCGLYHEASCA